MSEKIIFQGHIYSSETEMPPTVRDQYRRVRSFFADADQNGTPDFVQSNPLQGLKDLVNFTRAISQASSQGEGFSPDQFYTIQIRDTHVIINGRKFDSPESMPLDVRTTYDRLVAEAETNQASYGSWRGQSSGTNFQHHGDALIPDSAVSSNSHPGTLQEVNANMGIYILIAIASTVLCGVGIWFVLRGGL